MCLRAVPGDCIGLICLHLDGDHVSCFVSRALVSIQLLELYCVSMYTDDDDGGDGGDYAGYDYG